MVFKELSGRGSSIARRVPTPLVDFEVEGAIEGCDSLTDPDEPEAGIRSLRLRETTPVIFDCEGHGSLAASESDTHGPRIGMLDDVRESLLSDAEDGGLELRRQSRVSRKIDLELDLRSASLFQTIAQVFEGWRETKLVERGRTKGERQPANIFERAARVLPQG